jgi:hypothetical protein
LSASRTSFELPSREGSDAHCVRSRASSSAAAEPAATAPSATRRENMLLQVCDARASLRGCDHSSRKGEQA